MTSPASGALRAPLSGSAPHLGTDRCLSAAGMLLSYPHLASCAACSTYVTAALDEVEVTLLGLVAPWTLSFHESSHRSDPRHTALEHFGL